MQVWAAAQTVLRSCGIGAGAARRHLLQRAMHSLFPLRTMPGTPMRERDDLGDARATAVYRGLIADTDIHALYRRTGCPVHSTYHLQRLRWWIGSKPEQMQRAHLWVGLKDWILHALDRVGRPT